MTRIYAMVCAVVALSFVAAPSALAEDSSSVSGYGGVAGEVQSSVSGYGGVAGEVNTKVSAAAPPKTVESLPFTGQDLALMFGAALVLVAVGLSLRRFARRTS